MSSSVQFDSGNTRMLWPGNTRPLYRFQISGPLVLGIPLAELVAEREHALLRACLLLVAPPAAEQGVEAVLLGGLEQDRGLDPVARPVRLLAHEAALDRVLDRGDDQLQAQLLDPAVAVGEDLE